MWIYDKKRKNVNECLQLRFKEKRNNFQSCSTQKRNSKLLISCSSLFACKQNNMPRTRAICILLQTPVLPSQSWYFVISTLLPSNVSKLCSINCAARKLQNEVKKIFFFPGTVVKENFYQNSSLANFEITFLAHNTCYEILKNSSFTKNLFPVRICLNKLDINKRNFFQRSDNWLFAVSVIPLTHIDRIKREREKYFVLFCFKLDTNASTDCTKKVGQKDK